MSRVSTKFFSAALAVCFAVAVVFAAVQPAMAHAPAKDMGAMNVHGLSMSCDHDCLPTRTGLDCVKHCLSSSAATPFVSAVAPRALVKNGAVDPRPFFLPKHRPVFSSGFIRPPPHGKRAWRDVHLKTQKRE